MSLRSARNFAIIALAALALTLLPGHGQAINAVVTVLGIIFFVAIALFGYRLFREHRYTIESLPDLDRLVLYGSIGLAFLAFAGWRRLTGAGGLGVLAALALLGLASLGVFWVYNRYRSYS